MKKIYIIILLIIWLPCPTFSQPKWMPVTYNVSFKIKNAGITVSGKFQGFKGDLVFDANKLPSSSLAASVEAATIKTGIKKRDDDLKDEKYFNTEKYPLITLQSTKLYKQGAQYAGTFNVTIKGVTKQMEIPFECIENGNEMELKGNFTIHRKDFGIGNKTLTMSDEANISIDVTAKK